MKQVFIADTHFGHDKFHSKDWEYKFWKKYNSINADFILYHLGDLSKDKKVVMSFWSWTGKVYIPSLEFSDNIGIKNCIKKYKKYFGVDKE